jgi:trehalose-6-phosphate synthase
LFSSAQSHNLDVSDTRRIIYVGLVHKVDVVTSSPITDAAGTAAAIAAATTTTTVDPSRLSTDLQDELARVLSTDYACFPIFLQGDTRASFYDNYCHKALWPTVHNNVDLTKGEHTTRFFNGLQHNEQYSAYRTVNSKFAKAVVEQYSDGDLIWVHDFHLALVPSFVLRKVQHATIGMFWHSPFPSSEIFRTLSVREDILRGILNCDQVGIHSYEYCRHFLTCCRRVLGLKYRVCKGGYWTVEYMGRDVRVTVAHACIDSALVAQRIASTSCKAAVTKVLGLIHPEHYTKNTKNGASTTQILREVRKVIGGIDRLESMCGIPEKMRGYEMFLAQNPSWVGRVVLVQIGLSVPERGADYENTRVEVAQLAARINRRYTGSADGGAAPVVIYSEMARAGYDDRLALWRCADVMCVCSKREGFNLLPFEYICSRPRVGAMRSLVEEDEETDDGSSGDDADGERKRSGASKRRAADGDTPLGSDPDTPGILLLSEFTSCCRVLSGALKVRRFFFRLVVSCFDLFPDTLLFFPPPPPPPLPPASSLTPTTSVRSPTRFCTLSSSTKRSAGRASKTCTSGCAPIRRPSGQSGYCSISSTRERIRVFLATRAWALDRAIAS